MKAKSSRFSEAAEAEIRDYAQLTGEQEAAMLERVTMRGLREERLEKGFRALRDGASSSEAAAIAGLDRHAFLNEAVESGVPLMDGTAEDMVRHLRQLAEYLGDEKMAARVDAASRKLLCKAPEN